MRVLIIGILEDHMRTAAELAKQRGANVLAAANIDDAIVALRRGNGADIALVDVRLDIGALVSQLNSERINIPVVACGLPDTTPRMAERAIQQGAREYLPLPPDADAIAAVLEAVSKHGTEMIYADENTTQVIQLADQIAPSEASVLITGQSGTGKEVMARYIHKKSKRADKAFVAINCAALPEALLESELFGHEKGAFTGAIARRIGKFEEAQGGTILLDEITEMDLKLQAKLLRAIQEREIDRVGGTKPVKIDVRILATSNRNVQETVAKGDFREDLYFRLNVVNVVLPALSQRPQDIRSLAIYFIDKYAKINDVRPRPVSAATMERLLKHPWPGNVRELENTMHRAVLLARGDEISEMDIQLETPKQLSVKSDEFSLKSMADLERDHIINTFKHCLGDQVSTAVILGISVKDLRQRLEKYSDSI